MSIFERLRRPFQFDKVVDSVLLTADAAPLQPGQIDVRDLIARYDSVRHSQLADAYFEPLLDNPIHIFTKQVR